MDGMSQNQAVRLPRVSYALFAESVMKESSECVIWLLEHSFLVYREDDANVVELCGILTVRGCPFGPIASGSDIFR